MNFTELSVSPALAQILEKRGMSPLPVQELAIPALLNDKSARIVSRTGSGKTLAYLLPVLSRIDPQKPDIQAVVLAPTHELAMQINRVASELARDAGLPVRIQPLIGGVAVARQIEGLKKKPHLVVGSAGRIAHLMELGKLRLRHVRWMIFDEADRLLADEGMAPVRRIAAAPEKTPCHVFVSATEGPPNAARELARDPELLKVREERINPAIRHVYLVCEERDKIDWARRTVRGLDPARTLIFVHRGATAERAASQLAYHGLSVADLHGARDKLARQTALERFRKGEARVLIASDIAARGLDIAGVDLVINMDAPTQSRDYLHRAGRTGRAGQDGLALSLMTEAETRLVQRYARELDIMLEAVRLARGELIAAHTAPLRKKTGRPEEMRKTRPPKPKHP